MNTILILHASGTNRDGEAQRAVELAGGCAEIVHVNQLRSGERRLADYGGLLLPRNVAPMRQLGHCRGRRPKNLCRCRSGRDGLRRRHPAG